jgi:hypothetical protein
MLVEYLYWVKRSAGPGTSVSVRGGSRPNEIGKIFRSLELVEVRKPKHKEFSKMLVFLENRQKV